MNTLKNIIYYSLSAALCTLSHKCLSQSIEDFYHSSDEIRIIRKTDESKLAACYILKKIADRDLIEEIVNLTRLYHFNTFVEPGFKEKPRTNNSIAIAFYKDKVIRKAITLAAFDYVIISGESKWIIHNPKSASNNLADYQSSMNSLIDNKFRPENLSHKFVDALGKSDEFNKFMPNKLK